MTGVARLRDRRVRPVAGQFEPERNNAGRISTLSPGDAHQNVNNTHEEIRGSMDDAGDSRDADCIRRCHSVQRRRRAREFVLIPSPASSRDLIVVAGSRLPCCHPFVDRSQSPRDGSASFIAYRCACRVNAFRLSFRWLRVADGLAPSRPMVDLVSLCCAPIRHAA